MSERQNLKLFFKLVWRLNYYEGVDRLTFFDWIYRYRISIRTAWKASHH